MSKKNSLKGGLKAQEEEDFFLIYTMLYDQEKRIALLEKKLSQHECNFNAHVL